MGNEEDRVGRRMWRKEISPGVEGEVGIWKGARERGQGANVPSQLCKLSQPQTPASDYMSTYSRLTLVKRFSACH